PAHSTAISIETPRNGANAASPNAESEGASREAPIGTLVSMGSISGSSGAPRVSALCVANERVYAGTSDGRLLAWPCRAPDQSEVLLSGEGGRIESVQWMLGAGVQRLLVACQRPYAWLLVCGDAWRGEYRTDEPVRWAAAADDWIAGVNDRRDRIYLWRPWQPESVERTIFVGRMTGHSIQGVALVPRD
ncbi:MAG: hypothetical protein V3T70_10595, partial [Phycisphaerae bacterium]